MASEYLSSWTEQSYPLLSQDGYLMAIDQFSQQNDLAPTFLAFNKQDQKAEKDLNMNNALKKLSKQYAGNIDEIHDLTLILQEQYDHEDSSNSPCLSDAEKSLLKKRHIRQIKLFENLNLSNLGIPPIPNDLSKLLYGYADVSNAIYKTLDKPLPFTYSIAHMDLLRALVTRFCSSLSSSVSSSLSYFWPHPKETIGTSEERLDSQSPLNN